MLSLFTFLFDEKDYPFLFEAKWSTGRIVGVRIGLGAGRSAVRIPVEGNVLVSRKI